MTDVTLWAGSACAVVSPQAGGRITSLVVADRELLAVSGTSVVEHGSFVMAPWAGRIRDGELYVDGHTYRLPTDRTHPHAGHGLVMDRPWQVLYADDRCVRLRCDLDGRWPFAGHVFQEIVLHPDALEQRVEVHADEQPFPVTIGWHPWFPRDIGGVSVDGGPPAQFEFRADGMLRRDAAGIPDGTVVPVPEGPWDDCFTGVHWPATITWPGQLTLRISADTDYLVVYNERADAFCVEPQSGPPDGPNTEPVLARPGAPVTASTVWNWELAQGH